MLKEKPDLILLDIMLPGDDGLTVLRKIKENQATKDIPVIIVSAMDSIIDKVKGFDLGADDYLCKPFQVLELTSRVKARLRGIDKHQEMHFLDITLSQIKRTVTIKKQKIDLSYKEFELLLLFMSNPNIVLNRDYILDMIWGHEGSSRSLDVHIRTLRSKLGSCGRYIKTVRNVGYKLEEV